MNNQQFRNLMLDNAGSSRANGKSEGARGAETPSLGSKMRSSIPMTPRSVSGFSSNDFRKQLAAQDADSRPVKKFRTSAPKGSKLASGYRDRTKDRADDTDQDSKEARIKALEDAVKLGQLEPEVFVKLRDKITGGDVSSTHLVKGLDWKLLKRVREGEDVLVPKPEEKEEEPAEQGADVDDELDRLEDAPVAPVARTQDEKPKKGQMVAPPPPVAGTKRTRDSILAEMKAARRQAAAAAVEESKAEEQPQLGPKFRKAMVKQPKSRIERDERGREVLITVDENGKIKRKVRREDLKDRGKGSSDQKGKNGLLMPDKNAKPLGSDVVVPELPPQDSESDDDIFQGIGADYDPLGNDDSGSSSDSDSSSEDEAKGDRRRRSDSRISKDKAENTSASTEAPPRNYFEGLGSKDEQSVSATSEATNPLKDPSLLSSIAKASALSAKTRQVSESMTAGSTEQDKARAARRAAMLSGHDRDADDLDMGFGSSRMEDEEEASGERVKLQAWTPGGGADGDEGKDGARGGGSKRKRGPKKKKADKNNVGHILKAVEGQRSKSGGEK